MIYFVRSPPRIMRILFIRFEGYGPLWTRASCAHYEERREFVLIERDPLRAHRLVTVPASPKGDFTFRLVYMPVPIASYTATYTKLKGDTACGAARSLLVQVVGWPRS